LHKSPLFRE